MMNQSHLEYGIDLWILKQAFFFGHVDENAAKGPDHLRIKEYEKITLKRSCPEMMENEDIQ